MTTSGGYAGELRVVVSRCHDVTSDRGGASADPGRACTTSAMPSRATPRGASRTTSTATTPPRTRGCSPASASDPTRGRWTSGCRCGSRAASSPSTAAHGGPRGGRHDARGRRGPLRDARTRCARGASRSTARWRRARARRVRRRRAVATSRSSCLRGLHPADRQRRCATLRAAHRRPRPPPPAPSGRATSSRPASWSGWLDRRRRAVAWPAAYGNRDRSWGPRRWGGPRMWRWFSINVDDGLHLGGIRLGTDAGDLHRGWVWDRGRATSVAAWRVRTELADDGLTQRVVHLEVLDKEGADVPAARRRVRVADIGAAGGTLVNEGLARWTYDDPGGADRTGLRDLRVPAPARHGGPAGRPRRVVGTSLDVESGARAGPRWRRRAPRTAARAARRGVTSVVRPRRGPTAPGGASCSSRSAGLAVTAAHAWTCRRRSSRPRSPPGSPARASSPRVRRAGSIPAGWSSSASTARPSPDGCCATRSGPTRARALTGQCARALAAIHAIDPGTIKRAAGP